MTEKGEMEDEGGGGSGWRSLRMMGIWGGGEKEEVDERGDVKGQSREE